MNPPRTVRWLRAGGPPGVAALACWLLLELGSVDAQPISLLGTHVPVQSGRLSAPAAVRNPFDPELVDTFFSHWRALKLQTHLGYRFYYSDAVPLRLGEQVASALHQVSGGFDLGMGSRWSLGYSGTQSFYSQASFRDARDHQVTLAGATTYEEWSLQLRHTYETRSIAQLETGQQTLDETHHLEASVGYSIGSQARADLAFSPSLRSPVGFSLTREWPVSSWLQYKLSPWLIGSVGARGGFVDIRPGTNLVYYRPQWRLQWRPREVLQVEVHGGREEITFYSRPGRKLRSDVFGAMVQARLRSGLQLELARERQLGISHFSGHVSETTQSRVELRQALQTHFQLSAGMQHYRVRYLSDPLGYDDLSSRRDRHRSGFVRLTTTLRESATFSLSYQRSLNDSNADAFDLVSNQYGFEADFRF